MLRYLTAGESHGHSLTAIVTPRFHYIRTKQGDEQLYDHLVDPDEANDISRTPAGQAALPALRAILARETNGR